MFRPLFYLLLIILVSSCADQSATERTDGFSDVPGDAADSLFKDVMEGHDVAMAKMGKLAGYRKAVERKLDTLGKLPAPIQAAIGNVFKDLKEELKQAEDGMNQWMQDFNIDSAENHLEERLKYLESEKNKVNKVRDDIFSVLDKADSLLQKTIK